MKVIGYYENHDQCIAVSENGRIVLAQEEERPTRVKHSNPPLNKWPKIGYDWIKSQGYSFEDADLIAVATPSSNSTDVAGGFCDVTGFDHKTIGQKVRAVEHHDAHIALAHKWSGWENCYALAIDGGGREYYGVAAKCDASGIHQIASEKMTEERSLNGISPGTFYMFCTMSLGFEALSGEGKTMGIAAGGDRSEYRALFDAAIEVAPFASRQKRPFSELLLDIKAIGGSGTVAHRNMCAAVQDMFERMIMSVAEAYIPKGERLVLSGGCFANVMINRRLLDWASEVFVAAAMNDGGLAAGAALAIDPDSKPYNVENVYLGYDAGGTGGADPKAIARLIEAGCVVALCFGQAEHGPRALGHRSLLADPRRSDVPAKVNSRLHRSGFMPFAPSLLATKADDVLEPDWRRAEHTAEFMTMTFKAKEGWSRLAPAVIHVDGTCRPQVLKPGVNPFFEAILESFYERTGIPMLLQTSLNRHGEPIIHDEAGAIELIKKGGADVLVSSERIRWPS